MSVSIDSKSRAPGWAADLDLVATAKARTPAGKLPGRQPVSLDRIFEAGVELGVIARDAAPPPCPACSGSGRLSSRVTCRPCGGSGGVL